MRKIIQMGLVGLILVMLPIQSQSAKPSTKDAFIGMQKKTFKKQYKRLAMSPIVASPALAMPEQTAKLIEQELLKKLDKSGYDILSSDVVRGIADQFKSLYGSTQKVEAAEQNKRQKAISDHAYRELYYRHPVDGLITVQVMPVAAPFNKDTAKWGGTSQKIKHRGDGLMKFITGKSYSGHIAASSIRVTITNRDGAAVYRWEGGIEVLMQRHGESLVEIPKTEFWHDEKRVIKAAKYVLKPL